MPRAAAERGRCAVTEGAGKGRAPVHFSEGQVAKARGHAPAVGAKALGSAGPAVAPRGILTHRRTDAR